MSESIRTRFVRILKAAVGLSAAPERLAAFAAFVGGPAESKPIAIQMVTYRSPTTHNSVSTCALVMRAALREAGVIDHRISASYVPRVGLGFTDILTMGAERRALITLEQDTVPLVLPGDIVIVDGDKHSGHMYGVTAGLPDGVVESVDGGQVDDHDRQCVIARRKHWVHGEHGFWYDKADDGGPQRRITHIIDIAKFFGEDASTIDPPIVPKTECIDISLHNTKVDLARVQAAGIGLVGLRGTIGRVFNAKKDIDQTVYARAKECLRLRLPFYVYGDVFARHDRMQDAEVQALDLWKLHVDVGATIVPMQDVESEGGVPPTGAEWRVAVDAYADVLEVKVGKPSITYTGPGFWSQYRELVEDTWMKRTHLHMAAYLTKIPPPPKPWTEITMWQRVGNAPGFVGHVDGVDGPVDRSTLFKPIAALRV